MLRAGGVLVGCDSVDTPEVRAGRHDDIFVPGDLDSLGPRQEAAEFDQIDLEAKDSRVRFAATRAA